MQKTAMRGSAPTVGAKLATAAVMILLAGTANATEHLEVSFDGPDEYTPGDSGIYTLVITNNDTANDTIDITTTFPDPGGTTIGWECTTSSTCPNPTTGDDEIGESGVTLDSGDSITYEVTAEFDADLTDPTVTFSATVTSTDDTVFSDSAESDLKLVANLYVDKTSTSGTYTPGESVDGAYTIEVSNAGPSDASGVTLVDDAPDGMTIDAWTCSSSSSSSNCPNTDSGGNINETVAIAAGDLLTYTLDASYDADAGANPLQNEATLTIPGELNDPDGTDGVEHTESDTFSKAREAKVDLSALFKTDTPATYTPGTIDNVYTVELENAGPSDAQSATATVIVTLDAEEDVDSLDFECTPRTTNSTCTPALGSAGEGDVSENPSDPEKVDITLEFDTEIEAEDGIDLELDFDYSSRALTDSIVIDTAIAAHADDTDTDEPNDSDQASFGINRQADFSIAKTTSLADNETSQNGEYEYFIEVTNNGPSDVGRDGTGDDAILVNDIFSINLDGQASECPEGDGSQPCWQYCSSDTKEQVQDIGPDDCPTEIVLGRGDISDLELSISAGTTSTIKAFVSVGSGAEDSIDNTATAELKGTGPVTETGASADNEDSVSVGIVTGSDISVTKDDGTEIAVPGEQHSYTIVVENLGFTGVNDVRVDDIFPLYVDSGDAGFVSGSISFQCEAFDGACCNHNSQQCGADDTPTAPETTDSLDQHAIDLEAGSRVEFTVTGELHPRATGTLANTATITLPAGFDDPDENNNTATDDNTVLEPEADLSISKKVLSVEPEDGPPFTLTYQIDVINHGPSHVESANVTDDLADGLLEPGTASWYCEVINPAGGTECGLTSPDTPETNASAVDEPVVLGPDGSVRLTVTVDTTETADGEVANTAEVSSDSAAGSDSATVITGLKGEADLTISKTSNLSSLAPGLDIEYLITVTNEGPDNVFGASVTDTFPPEIEDVAWQCEATTPVPGDLNFQNFHGNQDITGHKAVTSADGNHVYAIARDTGQLFAFDRDATPGLTFGEIAMIDSEQDGINDTADSGGEVSGMATPIDVMIAPDGHHVYVLSAGSTDTDPAIATFERNTNPADPDFGRLTFVDRVNEGIPAIPRNFAMTGDFLYVSGDELMAIFARDPATGLPNHDDDHDTNVPPAPGPIVVDPGRLLLFAGSSNAQGISAYSIEPTGSANPAGQLSLLGENLSVDTSGIVDMTLAPDADHLYAIAAGAGKLIMLDHEDIDDGGTLGMEFDYDSAGVGGAGLIDATTRLDISIDGEHILLSSNTEDALIQMRRDPVSGGLTSEEVLTSTASDDALANVSNLVITPDGRHVLLVLDGSAGGTLARYSRRAPDPLFAFVENDIPDRNNEDAWYAINDMAISRDGEHVYAVNLADNAIDVFRRDPASGVTDDTMGNHLQHVTSHFQSDETIDGLTDPSRILISPDGKSVYVTGQESNTLAVFDRIDDSENPDFGRLTFQTLFTDGQDGIDGLNGAQGMAMDKDNRHLYVAGRFESSIAIFERDATDQSLTWLGRVRNGNDGVTGLAGIFDLVVSADGEQLLGVSTTDNALSVFNRNTDSGPDFGKLEFVESRQDGIGEEPVALAMPGFAARGSGEHVYVASRTSDSIAALRRVTDPTSSAFGHVQPIEILENGGDSGITFMDGPRDVVVSPDGKRVYVAAENDGAVVVFDRDLNESSEGFGRLNRVETRRNTVDGVAGLGQVRALAVSNDSRNVYAGGLGNGANDPGSVASFLLGTGSLCTAGGGGNIDDRVDVGVGGTLVYRARGTVRADASGELVNEAIVAAPELFDESDDNNNIAEDRIDLIPEGDIDLIKSSENTSVIAGETARYDITITNPGPSNLVHSPGSPLTLKDTLDPDYFDVDTAVWTCEASGSGALEFIEAHLSEADGGAAGFEAMRGISGLDRFDAAGSIPVIAAASVIDNAVLVFGLDELDGFLDAPRIIHDGDSLPGGTVNSLEGARSLVASGDGRFLYVASRIADSVTVFELIDDNGSLVVELVDVQDSVMGLDQAVHLVMGPEDEHLYVAGSNDDAIAVFTRNADGSLSWLESEQHGVDGVDSLTDVEHLTISPDGEQLYALSGSSGRIAMFDRNTTTGELAWNRSYGETEFGEPLDGVGSAAFNPSGSHLYVAAAAADRILVLERNVDGELSLASSIAQSDDGVAGLSGVRQLAFSDDGTHLYATSPIADSIAWFVRDSADGSLGFGGVRANTSTLVDGLDGASDLLFDAGLNQIFVAGTQQPAISRFQRRADSFCPASGTGNIEDVPFDIAAGGNVHFRIEVDVKTDVEDEVANIATVTAASDTDTDNNTDDETNPVVRRADLSISKDDGLREFDGLQGAAAVVGNADNLYTAGGDDSAIGIFERDDGSSQPGKLTFRSVLRDGEDGLTGLSEVSDLALDSNAENLYAVAQGDNTVIVFDRQAGGGLEFVQLLQNGVDNVSGLSGARSLALSPDDAHVYVAGNFSNAIVALTRTDSPGDETHGQLQFLQTLEHGVNSVGGLANPVALAVAPDGGQVYALGRGDDTLAVLNRNNSDGSANFGRLEYVTHYTNETDGIFGLGGARDLVISDDGAYLYVLGDADGTLAVFERDSASGELTCVENDDGDCFFRQDGFGETTGLTGAQSLQFSPSGGDLYVAGDGSISRYSIDPDKRTPKFASQIANGDPSPLTGGEVFGLEGGSDLIISSDGMQLYSTAAESNALVTFERGAEAPGELDFRDIIIDGLGGIAPGEDVFYTIVVENQGPSDALDTSVVDVFPEQFEQVSWTCTAGGGAQCLQSGDGNLDTTVELPVGGRVTFTAGGRIKDNATGTLINTAQVDGAGILDPDLSDNEATDDDTILAPAMDLVVDVDDGTGEVTPGLSTTYQVRVQNLGPSYASDIRLEDELPAALFDATWQCLPQPRAGVLESPALIDPALSDHRDMVFSSNGHHAYVSGHDNGTSAIAMFRRNAGGGQLTLEQTLIQGSDDVIGLQGVDGLALAPDGRFLYAAASNADGIAIFGRDSTTGELTFVDFVQDGDTDIQGLGGVSRLLFSPDGAWLYAISGADQALATFAVDESNGALNQVDVLRNGDELPDDDGSVDGLNGASAMAWIRDGEYLLVTGQTNTSLAAFQRNPITGILEPATIVLDSDLGGDALSDPVALTVTEADEVFVASAMDDRVDQFEFSTGEDDDSPQFEYQGEINAATLDIATLPGPADLAYDPDRRRLYIQHEGGMTLVGLMRPEPEVIAQYESTNHAMLAGINALALGPDQRQLYSLGSGLAVWSRKRGSRCDVLGEGALGQQMADISAGGEVLYEVNARIQANATGEIGYPAEAGSALPEQELNAADNLDVDFNLLVPGPDLAANKFATPDPVVAGEDIEFRIDTSNDGPSDALEALLVDALPIHPDVTGGLLAGSGAWSCQANPPLDIPDGYPGDDPFTDVVVGTYGIYSTGTDAVIIRPRNNGAVGSARIIREGDAISGGTVTGLSGTSSVAVSADERHLYVTGSDDDSLVVFTRETTADEFGYGQTIESGVDGVSGLLQPQAVRVSEDGGFVYAASDPPPPSKPAIAVFSRDDQTGGLEFVERQADGLSSIEPESDVLYGVRDVLVSGDGTNLFSAASDSDALTHFKRNPEDGTLVFESVWRNGDTSDGQTITIEGARGLATSPADEHLYVLGEHGLARFDRDDHDNLSYAQAWMNIPDLGMPRSIHIDPAGTRLYLLDDAAVHVFARDWANGDLEHRNRIELTGGSALYGDSANSQLWIAAGNELLAYPELALSRCLETAGTGDFIDLDLDLGAGGHSEVVYDATVHPSARGNLVNKAGIIPKLGEDPIEGNNLTESTTEINVESDIAITKTGPDEAVAGETIEYQFLVTNAGPSDALGIGVVDSTNPPGALLDAEWTCSASGSSQCPATSDGSDFTADLHVGDELVIDVVATVDPSVVGEMTNTAEVIPEAGSTDPNPNDQSSSVTTRIEAIAKVAVAKTLIGDAPVAGDTVTWEINVDNAGPSDAPEVAITDVLDTRLSAPEWTCTGSGGGQCPASGTGDLDFNADLPAGSAVLVTVTGELPSSASGLLDNSVSATVAEPASDPDTSDNSAETSDAIAIRPDLAIEIIAQFDPIDPDGDVDLPLILKVDNNGPSDASNAHVEIEFNASVELDSSSACSGSEANWQCNVGSLAAGDTEEIDLAISELPDAGTDLVIDVVLVTTDDDPNLANNSDQRVIGLVNGPDVFVTIDNGVEEVRLKDVLTYTITVTNTGSVQADNVNVSVPISQDLLDPEWECQADGDVGCQPSGNGDVTDTIDLGPGKTATYTLVAQVDPDLVADPDQSRILTQPAEANLTGGGDINTVNNSDSDDDLVLLTIFRDRFEAPASGGMQ